MCHSIITFALKGGVGVHQNANICKQGEGVSHQCKRPHLNFFNFNFNLKIYLQ